MIKNKIKIFIKGAYNAYNFGDDAIFIAILYFLEKNLGLTEKNCQIYIEKNNNSFEKLNCKFDLKLKDGVNINEIFEPINSYLKLFKFPKFLRLIFVSFILGAFFINILFFRIFKKKIIFKDIITFFENLDIIHYIGGGYITDRWKIRMVRDYLTVNIAKRINPDLKIIGTGLGLGPFKSKISLFFLKKFLSKFDYLFLRERQSFDLVTKLSINTYVKCCGDDVLLLFPLFKELKYKKAKLNKKTVGFNLKDFPDHNYIKIKKNMEKFLNLLQTENFEIKYFCFGQKPGPDDYSVLLNLDLKLTKDLIIHNPYKQGFCEFIENLAKVNFGIGFAYHFNVILSIMDIPSIAIYAGDYYKQKIEGAMKLFDTYSYVINIDNIQKSKIVSLIRKLITSTEKNSKSQRVKELYNNMLTEYISAYKQIITKN
ncbi:MAG: polysaccharide pyruvyl transferase family protein [Candidatus Helarchaeota archaeon]